MNKNPFLLQGNVSVHPANISYRPRDETSLLVSSPRSFCIYLCSYCIETLFLSLHVSRLLLMEKHHDRVLVHSGSLWDAEQIRKYNGAGAHHDPSEVQGGSSVRVRLQFTGLSCKETNPMHCVDADQRDVF